MGYSTYVIDDTDRYVNDCTGDEIAVRFVHEPVMGQYWEITFWAAGEFYRYKRHCAAYAKLQKLGYRYAGEISQKRYK